MRDAPAFPIIPAACITDVGLTKREYAAIHIMAAALASPFDKGVKFEDLAIRSIGAADCLLAELDRTAKEKA